MSPPSSRDDPIDETEFATALKQLIERARDSDIQLVGAWDARSPHPDESDYTIEITRQTKRTFGWDRDQDAFDE